jgi:hypothetical protein
MPKVALTRGEESIAQLHDALIYLFLALGAGFQLVSVYALSWLASLAGFPAPLNWVAAAAVEFAMAATSAAVTTAHKHRKPAKDGTPRPDGYFLLPWLVFAVLMGLAQSANVGHAMTEVASRLHEFPPGLPPRVPYILAGAFAALFPLGGTFMVYMSGFLRMHGQAANWVEDGARTVSVRASSARSGERAARKQARTVLARTARDDHDQDAAHDAPPDEALALTADEMARPEPERARLVYDRWLATRADKPVARHIRRIAGIENTSESQVRRWVQRWSGNLPRLRSVRDGEPAAVGE